MPASIFGGDADHSQLGLHALEVFSGHDDVIDPQVGAGK
jgi:hypothetical protein